MMVKDSADKQQNSVKETMLASEYWTDPSAMCRAPHQSCRAPHQSCRASHQSCHERHPAPDKTKILGCLESTLAAHRTRCRQHTQDGMLAVHLAWCAHSTQCGICASCTPSTVRYQCTPTRCASSTPSMVRSQYTVRYMC